MVDKFLLEKKTKELVEQIQETFQSDDELMILEALNDLMESIPDKRRSSYGIVSVIAAYCKSISKYLSNDCIDIGKLIYEGGRDFRVICIGLGLISHYGVDHPEGVLSIIKEASDHEQWEVKEFVQMFIRKITKVHKDLVQNFLLEMTESENPNHRRFASEALRPVVENKWIHDEPDYSLKVLRKLFKEHHEFPRVSVGNNLSDLSRKNPDLIFSVIRELKRNQDNNSDFIAHRACRNLVKTQPIRVMDLLEIDCYEYKNKKYHRSDYK